VQRALVCEKLRAFVRDVRLFALAERNLPRECGAMLALDVVVQVGWRKQDPTDSAIRCPGGFGVDS
jgi:hypothetical protein